VKIRYVVLIILLLGVGWFQFTQIEPKRNRNNASQVRLGMTSEEVIQLMGSPDKKSILFTTRPDVDYTYSYRAPFASSEGTYISFDKQGQVVHIVNE
jgi:outer membrane protein assembly factor BamE (lipoprotein component of BamABCDE complex)